MQGAYLEDYQKIKIIVNNDIFINFNNVFISSPNYVSMNLVKKTLIDSMWHLEYDVLSMLETHIDYKVCLDNKLTFHLLLGKITRSPLFEKMNYTDEELGFTYNKEYTEFKLWTPVAKEVILVLPRLDKEVNLHYSEKGIWKICVYRDLEKEPYYYKVRINNEFFKSLDPYAVSSSANSEYNYVVDLKKTYYFEYEKPTFSGHLTDAIILEMHLKDFGYCLPGDDSYYSKAANSYPNIGLNYVKSLGVTHVQVLPLNAFYGVDEKDNDKYYNWGYNPLEYFSITGWYASNPDDCYNRINELKRMIDLYHNNGILVNLDVVFNHVYKPNMFSMNLLVPGYVFRTDGIGFMTNGSGCGNDLATEHLMVRKLIVDALCFYAKFYRFDGFRFDLMGLIDIETIKLAEAKIKEINQEIILYGEGWEMMTGIEKKYLASNKDALPDVGYFNDYFRNIVKGNPFDLSKGIITGARLETNSLKYLIKGCNNPNQSLNFIECHDNYTIYDQMNLVVPKLSQEARKDYLKLGLGLLILSQGIPFIHLGMEFGRSKKGYDNSYNLSIDINKIDWSKLDDYKDVIESLKSLITLRKMISLFRLRTKEDVEKYLRFDVNDKVFSYHLRDYHNHYQVIINDSYDLIELNVCGTLIYNGIQLFEKIEKLKINKPGIFVINK